jgi:5-(carboxyamino)imidazole ribonucleotide synthase
MSPSIPARHVRRMTRPAHRDPDHAGLGVMGGGQLGRMFVHAAQRMGYFTAVLDPDPASPAGRVSHHHIQTAYTDPQGLQQLAQHCVAVTTEFENVPARRLRTLARSVAVSPAASACGHCPGPRAKKKPTLPLRRARGALCRD